jgi:hypothetical protein
MLTLASALALVQAVAICAGTVQEKPHPPQAAAHAPSPRFMQGCGDSVAIWQATSAVTLTVSE